MQGVIFGNSTLLSFLSTTFGITNSAASARVFCNSDLWRNRRSAFCFDLTVARTSHVEFLGRSWFKSLLTSTFAKFPSESPHGSLRYQQC